MRVILLYESAYGGRLRTYTDVSVRCAAPASATQQPNRSTDTFSLGGQGRGASTGARLAASFPAPSLTSP
ncbi:unnamed protein product [Parnassius apollo]|uniref:(apollo) hypothetical protein n=1 Tax=Parnassius apollo TaxID=110799 RepID=A0A8S3XAE0_PARAO|nr:unnamed protein product [Parnassius apollo]